MRALHRKVLDHIQEEVDPSITTIAQQFSLTEKEALTICEDWLATGRDRVISNLIPVVVPIYCGSYQPKG